jgi:WD40 repeat protein
MRERSVFSAISLGFILVVIVMAGGLMHLLAAVPVDAQSVTPTPLSLTPVGAPLPQSVPITASNVDRLTLFAAMDVGPFKFDPIWLPDHRLFLFQNNTLNTLLPPDGPSLELELYPNAVSHPGCVVSFITASADGRLIVGGGTFSPDGVLTGFVQVWDAATGRVLAIVKDLEGGLWSMALSPDGKYLAADTDGLRVWQVTPDGTLLSGPQVQEQYGNIGYLAFSPDSLLLAATVYYGLVIYSFDPEQEPISLEGRTIVPNQLAFSPDGSLLAAISQRQDGDILVIWDMETGEQTDLTIPSSGLWNPAAGCLSFSSDGSLLAAAFWGEVRLWDVSRGQAVALMQVESSSIAGREVNIDRLVFSPDGTLLMAGDRFGHMMWLWGIQ